MTTPTAEDVAEIIGVSPDDVDEVEIDGTLYVLVDGEPVAILEAV